MRTICFISHKGGVGKTTLAASLAAAGLEMGLRVGVLDLDTPTLGLTRFATLRAQQGLATPVILSAPLLPATRTQTSKEAGALVGAAVDEAKLRGLTLLLIDLEAVTNALWLKAAACLIADQIITPIADSPLDLASILPEQGEGDLAQFIGSAGARRPDWIVVRNRVGHLRTNLAELLGERVRSRADEVGYRFIDGLRDRVAYREMFQHGRTPLDAPVQGRGLSMSLLSARSELRLLATELLGGPAPHALLDWRSAANR